MQKPDNIAWTRDQVPDGLERFETLEFTIKWEVSGEEILGNRDTIDELNELFYERMQHYMSEKQAAFAVLAQEKITRKSNFAHGSRVTIGEYQVVLYRESE